MSRASTREGAETDDQIDDLGPVDQDLGKDLEKDRDEETAAAENATTAANEEGAEDSEGTETSEASSSDADTDDDKPVSTDKTGGLRWSRVFAYGVVPALALLLALGAGFAKWFDATMKVDPEASAQAVEAGSNGAIAMLSYQHDTAHEELVAASERLTGEFKDAYSMLVTEVVIPGAQEQQISAVASVPAAAPVSVTDNEAVVVVFVNQTTTVGNNPPTDLASTVRVTLDKVEDRWLISQFEPI
ncbi:hypothetical protein [Mycolicibacterium thermoresistibile]